jgi:ubiquinone/menaquinone biosynthesis C-methylase UbiE
MLDSRRYWDAISPYMDYLENVLGINLDNLGPLIPLITSPVLVIGAGQGLLVAGLREYGFITEGIDFSPQMIAYAKKRRGIKLILANANRMPFRSRQFKTSIVATGVVDFLDNINEIGAIINETRRVTDAQGEVFVASMGTTAQTEELLRYIGIMSDSNQLRLRIAGQMILESKSLLKKFLSIIRENPNRSTIGFVVRAIRSLKSTRKRIRAQFKSLRELKKKVKSGNIPDPKILLEYLPERLFLRSNGQIHELYKSLNFPPREIYVFDNCKIVQL